MNEINFFYREEEYGWLSNFWRCWLKIDGNWYLTNEHYYQSKKPRNGEISDWIANAPTPYMAMCAGRALRESDKDPEWEEKKVNIMLECLCMKFENPELRKKLLATGDAVIHEDSQTDMFWGKKGKDMLGKLLMQVREEIKE